jgi:hypothetical protein
MVMSVFRISEGVVFRELEGEAVLLNLDSGMYFGLDRIGTRIWQLVEQHGRIDRIIAALVDDYDVDARVLREDVARLLGVLVEKGLVIEGNDAAAGG